MAKKEWEVGPVLKDKLGSQGTLFRGGTKYSSDERYPRGYTPERQAAVRGAVQKGMSNPSAPAPNQPGSWEQQHRELSDTIARSTVPVEHLQNVQFAHTMLGNALTRDDTAAGIYMKPRGTREHGLIAVKPEYNRNSEIVTHEIGHHVSHTQDSPWRQNYSYSTAEGGQEESYADNYAQEHGRDRKGNPIKVGAYGGGQFAGRIERTPEFWDGYRTNRHYRADPEFDRENEKYFKAFPEERTHPDGSEDQPLVHRERQYLGYDEHGNQKSRDVVGDVNEDAIPTHANHDWSKYHG